MICLLPGSSVNQTAYHNMADDELLFEAGMAAYTVIVASSTVIAARKRRRKRRMMWVRPLFQRRSEYGAYNLLMAELRKSDADKYRGITRLTTEDFDELLSIVKVDISGSSRFRLPISPDVSNHCLGSNS